MNYWDTSALLKLYVPEHDSGFFLDLIAGSDEPVVSSALATIEVLCSLFRKELSGDLRPGGATAVFRRFRADCREGRIGLIPYGQDVAEKAEELIQRVYARRRPVMIRALDLIHLASAAVSRATIVVATDKRQRNLASILRFRLIP